MPFDRTPFENPERPFEGTARPDTLVPMVPRWPEKTTDDLLRELIDEVRGLRSDIKLHEIRTGKRLIGK